MRKAYLLVVVISISLVSALYIPSARADVKKGKAFFTYDTTEVYTESTPLIVYAEGEGVVMSEIKIWKESGNLYLKVTVWSKLTLAYGENDLDSNKDGIMDDTTFPYDYGKEKIKSDGVKIKIGLEDMEDGKLKGDEVLAEYEWKTDGTKHSYLDCLNYNDNGGAEPYTDWGIWKTPIEYTAVIPILSGWTSEFEIDMEVHASPPQLPEFWIPEFPMGTIASVLATVTAFGLFAFRRSRVQVLS